eukprot:scaffold9766_cov268-Amphora_coffeaeformis.AAC.6
MTIKSSSYHHALPTHAVVFTYCEQLRSILLLFLGTLSSSGIPVVEAFWTPLPYKTAATSQSLLLLHAATKDNHRHRHKREDMSSTIMNDDDDDINNGYVEPTTTTTTSPSRLVSRRRFGHEAVAMILGITTGTTGTGKSNRMALATSATIKTTTVSPPPPLTITEESSNPFTAVLDPAMDFVQFDTANDIPADYFKEQRYIYGFVERVIDGDTIRVRHIPGYGSILTSNAPPQPLQARGIANITLSIRIYGVDCPETGKNKRQTSQPYGDEAKQFTTDMVYHKMVKITLLRRDQYNRAVAVVETVPQGVWETAVTGPRDLSVALAQAGLAELYTGGGAEYYNQRHVLEEAMATAKRNKRGIWSLGDTRQSAAEFKRAQKQQTVLHQTRGGSSDTPPPRVAVTGWHTDNNSKSTTTVLGAGILNHDKKAVAAMRPQKKKISNKENLLDAVVTGLEFVG